MGVVERARSVDLAAHGWRAPGIAAELGVSQRTVRRWVKRFTAQGLAGLGDAPRSGRPATYPSAAVGELVAASLTDPQELDLPFGSWTLDRLAAYLHETKGIAMQRSRIGEILQAEGLRWRQHEPWCGERPDPASAKSFPGPRLVPTAPAGEGRARQEIDYGRRGRGDVFGAFVPATGAALTASYPCRTTATFVAFLEHVDA